MTDNTQCHQRDEQGMWLCLVDDAETVPMISGYCPTCCTRLGSDGSETRMVAAVASEAVRMTQLWQALDSIGDEWEIVSYTDKWAGAKFLCGSGMVDTKVAAVSEWAETHGGDSVLWARRTEQGRIIHAALQQPGPAPVASEAAHSTRLCIALEELSAGPKNAFECEHISDAPDWYWRALEEIGIISVASVDCSDESGDRSEPVASLTPDGRLLHAALSDTAGLAAAEWLAKQYEELADDARMKWDTSCDRCPAYHGCQSLRGATCAEAMLAAALAATGAAKEAGK